MHLPSNVKSHNKAVKCYAFFVTKFFFLNQVIETRTSADVMRVTINSFQKRTIQGTSTATYTPASGRRRRGSATCARSGTIHSSISARSVTCRGYSQVRHHPARMTPASVRLEIVRDDSIPLGYHTIQVQQTTNVKCLN